MKRFLMFVGVLLSAQTAFGCGTTVNGTTTECGSNWIRFRQNKDAFDLHKQMGSRGYVRRGAIVPGCLVLGPYVSVPYAGNLSGYISVEALVEQSSTPPIRVGFTYIPRIRPGDAMFTMDLVHGGGQVIGAKTVTYQEFTDWSGNGTLYGRCTGADPCTAGTPGLAHRNFKVYRNMVNLDMFARNISGPMDGIEVRLCNLNPWLSSMSAHESVIQLAY